MNRTTRPVDPAQNGGEFQAFALEDAEDSRNMRFAVAGAVVLHVVLFLVNFGFLKPSVAIAAAPPQKVFVVEPIRFKPQEPEPQRPLPEPRRPRVPIPDPTPDAPEPIRIEEEIRQEIDLAVDGIPIEIPDAPPPFDADNRPIPVGGDVAPPVKISGANPQYTEIARRARIEGFVIVQAIIDASGNVTSVKVLKPLPMGLDQAAVEAVSSWKFEPGTLNGKAVPVLYNLTVNFLLQR